MSIGGPNRDMVAARAGKVGCPGEESRDRVEAGTVRQFGGVERFRIIESLVQICAHGTHHRAQLINMLRHSGVTAPALDYGAWVPSGPLVK